MARMIPSRVPTADSDQLTTSSEARVFAALRDTLCDEYTAIGWVAWQAVGSNGTPKEGEADFVVIHPRMGFLVLEVKGGAITLDSDTKTWWSTDRHGVRHAIKNPLEQASRNRREIATLLAQRLGLRVLPFKCGQGVVFPDADGDPHAFGAAVIEECVVLRSSMSGLGSRVEKIFQRFSASWSESPMPADWPSVLEELIAPSVTLPNRLGNRVREVTQASDALTAEQFLVLDGLARNRRVLVTGAAGTGKTMLALEKARRLARAGARTLLTCFNRPLADFLRLSVGEDPGLEVHNFHQLCYRWALRNGFDGPDPDSDEVRDPNRELQLGRQYFDKVLPDAFLAALAKSDLRFDAIVVDEAQDFSETMQRALKRSLRNPRTGPVFAFQDEGQGIFEYRNGWNRAGLMEYHLSRNMRNTKQIHAVSKRLNPSDDAAAAGPDGAEPEFIPAVSDTAAGEAILSRIRTLATAEGIALSQIGVLTAGRREVQNLAPSGRLGTLAVSQNPFDLSGSLYLDRISRFKGLERDVIILTCLGDPPQHNRKLPLLYVAASRARSHLIIVDTPEVLARFQSGRVSTGESKGRWAN